jgi:CheY-like chemotaxis protein
VPDRRPANAGDEGLALQHHLRGNGIGIPTIVITAHNELAARQLCAAAGAQAYLLKPLQGPDLIAAINAATGRAWRHDAGVAVSA